MEQLDFLMENLQEFGRRASDFLPKLLLAIAVLLAGWLLARLVRLIARKALRAVNFHVLTARAGVDSLLERSGVQLDASGLLAILAYWTVILGSLLIAFNGVGLTDVADALGRVIAFIPKAFIAVLILAFGAYFARFAGESVAAYCRSVEIRDAGLLGKLVRGAVLVFVVLIALDQADLGGVVLALALAFGLGGRRRAAALLEHWWPTARRPTQ